MAGRAESLRGHGFCFPFRVEVGVRRGRGDMSIASDLLETGGLNGAAGVAVV